MTPVAVSTTMWLVWGKIAIGHRNDARALETSINNGADSANEATDLERMFFASVQAVTSAWFSVEALHFRLWDVHRQSDPDTNFAAANEKKKRLGQVRRAIKGSTSRPPAELTGDLLWLYCLRNKAVHFSTEQVRPTEPHPSIPGGFGPKEHVTFSVENADCAVRIMLACLAACVTDPTAPVETWASESAGGLDQLRGLLRP